MIIVFAASFILTALFGLLLVPYLRRRKLGQSIREEGPRWHLSKQGTPTMGGLMFIFGTTAAVLLFGAVYVPAGNYTHLYVLGFAWLYGLIGFVDDFFKVWRKQNLGLTALQKFALQLAVAAVLITLLRVTGHIAPEIYLPFIGLTFSLPWLIFLVLALLYTVGFVNAVNLTDGIDGLCTGVTLPIAAFFLAVSLLTNRPDTGLFASALCGGLLAFLLFNFHPARIFMGDTGSLFLGGAVCGLALALNRPLILIVVGLIYVLETLSVVLQVLYFKLTHGKRLFRMSPLHHHFEMGGWSEKKIFFVSVFLTTALCVVSYYFQ